MLSATQKTNSPGSDPAWSYCVVSLAEAMMFHSVSLDPGL